MNARAKWATAPLDVGGWSVPDGREHKQAISVVDKAGRVVARVPHRIDDLDVARAIAVLPDLLDAANAAIAYDRAIQACAGDPEKMSSFCTAQGDDLDALYFAWCDKARAALAKAQAAE